MLDHFPPLRSCYGSYHCGVRFQGQVFTLETKVTQLDVLGFLGQFLWRDKFVPDGLRSLEFAIQLELARLRRLLEQLYFGPIRLFPRNLSLVRIDILLKRKEPRFDFGSKLRVPGTFWQYTERRQHKAERSNTVDLHSSFTVAQIMAGVIIGLYER